MNTYIAAVEFFDQFHDEIAKDTVIMRANSYTEAVQQIETSFKNTIESITSITAVSDMTVIHLGDGPDVDKCVQLIMKENTF